jgi:hypothetical protein
MKTLIASLTALVLAVGMTACNRDKNAGAGSSAQPDKSAPASPQAPSKSSKY